MVFSSLIFLFSYLPFLLIGNYIWRNRSWQNILLFVGSLYFYAWGEGEKVLVMLASIVVNYFLGRAIGSASESTKRKRILGIGIVLNLGVLVYFKYAGFFVDNLNLLFHSMGSDLVLNIKRERLPIGISFYTFQSISYLVDVYREENKAQKNFINVGVYIALFPQLIAGPIVRYHDIAHQLFHREANLQKFTEGVRRFIIGLGKKVLIANTLAYTVDEIFAINSNEMTTPLAWLGMVTYAMQIYFDFSGYSDMAIGLGKMFGFEILENFNFPYIARSIKEFWKRWHISLSNWFMDYLYIPLGGNRGGSVKTYRNLFIVFLVTGFWHGASWSFVFWGLFHGLFMIIERLGFGKVLERSGKIFPHLYALLVVNIAWVFFRIDDFGYSLTVVRALFGFVPETSGYYTVAMFTSPLFWTAFLFGVILSVPFPARMPLFTGQSSYGIVRGFTVFNYLIIFAFCVISLVNSTYNPFIYFRF